MNFQIALIIKILSLLLIFNCDNNSQIRHYKLEKKVTESKNKTIPIFKEGIKWTPLNHWEVQPNSSMRIGSYKLPYSKGNGDLSIVKLGGTAGGLVANINRWRNQLNLEVHDESQMNRYIQIENSKIGNFKWLTLKSEVVDDDRAFLIAIFTIPNSSIFVKLNTTKTGIEELVDEFVLFCKSFEIVD